MDGVYMTQRYTTIRVSIETKRLLERLLAEMEARLGRRLDYDELLRMLAYERLRERRPWLLEELFRRPVEEHDTLLAARLLREERLKDERL
ncbi:hypothetical protein [Pyrolobus fumarii]|nr:hypothetical protein [Pyrolobus fumarii]